MATAAIGADESGAGLCGQIDFHEKSTTFPFGAHVAVVDVDIETGRVDLRRMVTCDDAGRIVNPLLVEGQRHGGIAQGAAQALLEEIRYDDDGNPITSNFADYGIISAAELPTFELETMETPTPANPLGAKGIGESARSVRRRPCRARCATQSPISAFGTSTSLHARAGVASDRSRQGEHRQTYDVLATRVFGKEWSVTDQEMIKEIDDSSMRSVNSTSTASAGG